MKSRANHGLAAVASAVGVHSSTIIRWLKDGKIPVKKKKDSRGHWVFTNADVAELKRYRMAIYSLD